MKKIYIILLSLLPLCIASCGSHSATEGEHGHSHESKEEAELELSEKQMQTVGIELGGFEMRMIGGSINATGVLEVSPQNQALAAPLASGIIKSTSAQVGRKVRKGEVLGYLETTDLMSMQQNYLEAETELRAARQELERQQALASKGAGVKKNLDAATSNLRMAQVRNESLANALRQYGINPQTVNINPVTVIPIKAPISGIITEVMLKNGQYSDMQTPLAAIVDNSAIYCTLNIYEKDIDKIEVSEAVTMRLTNNPEITLEGRVSSVALALDPDSKTIPVMVKLTGSVPGNLIPGMTVSATVASEGAPVKALPEGAVVSGGGKDYIFVLEDAHEEDGEMMYHFKKVEVSRGETALGYVETIPLTELPEDARIVVANAFYLNSLASDHGEHSH